MTFWLEQLDRLRKEQEKDRRPSLQLPIPLPPQGPPPEEGKDSERGVVIIGNDDDDEVGGIVISM